MSIDYLFDNITAIDSIGGVVVIPVNDYYFISTEQPLLADCGDYWYNPTTNILWVLTPEGWVNTGITVIQDTVVPALVTNTYWFNTGDGVLSKYDGTQWVALGGVVVNTIKTVTLRYSSTTVFNLPVINFDYSAIPLVNYSLVSPYDQMSVISNSLTFPYTDDSGKLNISLVATYGILNNRQRFGLLKNLTTPYDLPVLTTTVFSGKFLYSDVVPITASLSVLYSDVVPIELTLSVPYYTNTLINSYLVNGWNHTTPVESTCSFNYEISNKQYVFIENKFGYSISNQSIQAISTAPVLLSNGVLVDYIVINLSCDENSPFWYGDVSISNISDFSLFNINDDVQVVFNDLTFNLIIDGKNLSRGESADQTCKLTLISPLARLDNPFASYITQSYATPTLASVVVKDMIGTVEWGVVDWMVPVDQLQFTNTTPLSVARNIVSAIGGLIESNPDGSIVVRPTYPVNIPDYPNAPAIPLADSSLFNVSEDIAPQKIVNKLDLYTNDVSSIKDSLEFISDEGTNLSGVIHGYPVPNRQVNLIHTGSPSVSILPFGENYRTETETIEFKSGVANTRYPITSIETMSWHYTNLGAVTYSGNTLRSANEGESLLVISYRVFSYKFNVSGNDITQFLLTEA